MSKPLAYLSDFPYRQYPQEEELVEIFDKEGRTFLLTPQGDAKKKKMSRRIVFVILKDNRKRVLITKSTKNKKKNSILWKLSAYTQVYAGESTEDAAYRELKQNFNIEDIRLQELRTVPFLDKNEVMLSATIFIAGPWRETIQANKENVLDCMFVDKDELTGLLDFQPEMFHVIIEWALRSGWLFK